MIKLFKWNWIRAYVSLWIYFTRRRIVMWFVCGFEGHRWKWVGMQECGCCGYEGMRCLLCDKHVVIGTTAEEDIYGSEADDL